MWTALLGSEVVDLESMAAGDKLALRADGDARAALRCRGCKTPVHTRHIGEDETDPFLVFAHNPNGAKLCRELGFHTDESPEHDMLKSTLARAARRAGWRADLEVHGEGCRTDVLATSPGGRHWALEAQISALPTPDAIERTKRYATQFGSVTWSHTKHREWSSRVPSLQVDDESHLIVVNGIMTDPTGQVRADETPIQDVIPRILHSEITYVSAEDFGYYVDLTAQGTRNGRRAQRVRGEAHGPRGSHVRECPRTPSELIDDGVFAGPSFRDGTWACATCRKNPARWLAERSIEQWLACDTCKSQAERFHTQITFLALRTGA